MQNRAVRLCCDLQKYDQRVRILSQVKLVATALLYSVQIIMFNAQTVHVFHWNHLLFLVELPLTVQEHLFTLLISPCPA